MSFQLKTEFVFAFIIVYSVLEKQINLREYSWLYMHATKLVTINMTSNYL